MIRTRTLYRWENSTFSGIVEHCRGKVWRELDYITDEGDFAIPDNVPPTSQVTSYLAVSDGTIVATTAEGYDCGTEETPEFTNELEFYIGYPERTVEYQVPEYKPGTRVQITRKDIFGGHS